MAKKKGPPKPTRMYPSLHPDVALAVSEHMTPLPFNETNTSQGTNKSYSTFVIGEFRCHNNTCPTHAWTSGKVTILIRRYANGSYNAEVFKQRCRSCNRLGKLKLDNASYIDRVSYRLLAWSGVQQASRGYTEKYTPPHRKDLCEGCKRGICPESL
ncbi:zinc-binding domain-containing protein [Alternaria rosae]|uniref:zinc-binding domain-containing protein n=1 Tax=Alternaria rosae TaxID=1187941 RepID=UPI001E8D1E1D|nr:zinc-binding domain-containing protein [Alternaria rosae]KAH6860617.1 zinc-binding domain-containing protein [Alternaria rosae]